MRRFEQEAQAAGALNHPNILAVYDVGMHDGSPYELFFVSGNKLMATSVSSGTEFQAGTPQPLFEIEGTNYAPSKDGQRFLVSVVTEKAPSPLINVVQNWTATLTR